jgi:hypothetical protein
MKTDLRQRYKDDSAMTNKLKSLFDRTKKKAQTEEIFNKLIRLSDQKQRELYDEFMTGKTSRKMLAQRIDHLYRIAADAGLEIEDIIRYEDSDQRLAEDIEHMIDEDKKMHENDEGEIDKSHIKTQAMNDLDHDEKKIEEDINKERRKIKEVIKEIKHIKKMRAKQGKEAVHIKSSIDNLRSLTKSLEFDPKKVQKELENLSEHIRKALKIEDKVDTKSELRKRIIELTQIYRLKMDEVKMANKQVHDLEALKEDIDESERRV